MDPAQVLLHERPVEPELLAQLRHRGVRGAGAECDAGRIPGRTAMNANTSTELTARLARRIAIRCVRRTIMG
ncbi:hypothetical protein SANT12839_002240 [Streptomyces antimycoticus]|uniref:Uncharacterized protein n=1 Tax=Streptomyces antimycoticus TaxID=68175 RepID=A0A4D4JUL8_9ACTN|nr:hypothetical protein SANT12839_002240 [Streptomyces antimycoticus]